MITAVILAAIGFFAFIALLIVLFPVALTGGTLSATSGVSIQQATVAPQGTASSSTIPPTSLTFQANDNCNLAFGTGSGQINIIVAQDRTLALSSNETLNLNNIADLFGTVNTPLHLKFVAFQIVSGGDATGLLVQTGTSNGFVGYGLNSTGIIIYPTGPGFQNAETTVGIAVSSSTQNIKVTNNSSSVAVTYKVIFGATTT